MATRTLVEKTTIMNVDLDKLPGTRPHKVTVQFDGGRRDEQASDGWIVFADFSNEHGETSFRRIAYAAAPLGNATTVHAELSGAYEATNWALKWLRSLEPTSSDNIRASGI